MKKVIIIFIIFLCLFVGIKNSIAADTIIGVISGGNVGFRSCPDSNSELCPRITSLDTGDEVTLFSNDLIEGPGCDSKWYKGIFQGSEGYVCSQYVNIKTSIPVLNPEDYATYTAYLTALGFSEPGYVEKLAELHAKYPNWQFVPVLTSLNFNEVVSAQSVSNKSCTYSKNQGYYLTDSPKFNYLTDTFTAIDAGCYAANSQTVAYYLDPRNWLSEKNIFMFEDLTYHPEYQTVAAVNSILENNVNLKSYVNLFHAAANQTIDGVSKSINPMHLAARSRVEIGNDPNVGGLRVNGNYPYIYRDFALKGYYNFFNIGSYADSYTTIASARGMAYAAGENCSWCGFLNTYGRPWNTAEKGINGGAQFLINKYIDNDQDTIYFQKFNVKPKTGSAFSNQYMQNLAAPASEAGTNYNAYFDPNVNALDQAIVFKIPVYIAMNESNVLPNPGNPNNHLSNITINGEQIPGFAHDLFTYNLNLLDTVTQIEINANQINAKAVVTGIGKIAINPTMTILNINVKAENGLEQTYTINLSFTKTDFTSLKPQELVSRTILKSDGTYILGLFSGADSNLIINELIKINPLAQNTVYDANRNAKSGLLGTGDIITINSGNEIKEYPVIIVGDGNGDGTITLVDLLKIQKHILNINPLIGPYNKALDVNYDSTIDLKDLLKIQKYILGYIELD